jgi:hypothetical protein
MMFFHPARSLRRHVTRKVRHRPKSTRRTHVVDDALRARIGASATWRWWTVLRHRSWPAAGERLAAFKRDRDSELVAARLEQLRDSARGSANLLPAIREALRDRATLGEVCGALREVFGSYQPR